MLTFFFFYISLHCTKHVFYAPIWKKYLCIDFEKFFLLTDSLKLRCFCHTHFQFLFTLHVAGKTLVLCRLSDDSLSIIAQLEPQILFWRW